MNPQKLITTAVTIGAGLVATKALGLAWQGITGHKPPEQIDGTDDDVSMTEVIIFAAVSAAIAAVVRAYAVKGTAKWLGGAVSKG